MRADDDGFVNNPKKIQRMIGASEDDLKLLLAKRFILGFENGVIVIKHWRMHNVLRKDRYNPTQYQEQFASLELKENGSYTETYCIQTGNQLATNWQPTGNQLEPQDRLGKDSIGKDRLGKSKKDKPVRHKYGEFDHVLLTDEDMAKLQEEFPSDWMERIRNLDEYIERTGKSYKNHLLTIKTWARKDGPKKQTQQNYDPIADFMKGETNDQRGIW
jgi:hypothetical protein